VAHHLGADLNIDPLDGTDNLIQGLPLFATSIGVLYCGMPVVGALWCSRTHAFQRGSITLGDLQGKFAALWRLILGRADCDRSGDWLVRYGRDGIPLPRSLI